MISSSPAGNPYPLKDETSRIYGEREINVLRAMLTLAARQGMTDKNPATRPRKLPESKGRLRYLTTEEASLLLELAASGNPL